MRLHEVDLADPGLYGSGDPHPVFAFLRSQPGLAWNRERDGPGFWAVTRYADAVAVYRDTASFTSTRGAILRPDRGRPDPAGGRMLVMTDPPRHTKLRGILNRGFTPRTVDRLRARLDLTAGELLGRALERGRCDFVADVAARLPVITTCELMGVPAQDQARMLELTSTAFGATSGLTAANAHAEILTYYAELVERRRLAPGDDLVSLLATAEVDGRRLTDAEVLLDCDNLVVGGNETTRHAAAGGLLALVQHPQELERLRREPGLVEAAVEEILRWTTPGMHVLRTAARTAVVGGQVVRPGEEVVVWNVSANRDPAAFERPDRFDAGRSPNRHLAFGTGEHFCLGAAMARLELRALFARVLADVAAVELAGPVERLRSNVVCGLERLPVVLRPR